MKHKNIIQEEEITVFVDASLFSREAIFKCLYWYGDRFHTRVEMVESQTYSISLRLLQDSKIKPDELPLFLQKLERDLIDFQLRDMIAKETGNIRDLLVAKAFSSGEFDEEPPGEITDPVGFNPDSFLK